MKLVVKHDPVYRRRRLVALLILLLVVALLVGLVTLLVQRPWQHETTAASASMSTTGPGDLQVTPQAVPAPTEPTHLVERRRITGDITPRSLAASRAGLVLAMNMMYSHSVTAYDPAGELVATIPDAADLGALGVDGHPGTSLGAPVAADFAPDGRTAYVSNYFMTGTGFGGEPADACATDPSAQGSVVYRLDTRERKVTGAVAVGAVPKDVVVTPDGRTAVVADWCSGDLSVVDTAAGRRTARIDVGDHPRGLALSRDGRTAYVVVGAPGQPDWLDAVDVASGAVHRLTATGPDARQVAVLPDGGLLVTAAGDSTLRLLDPATGAERRRVRLPRGPRWIALTPDGGTAYVVSYDARVVTSVRTSDLVLRSSVRVPEEPSGVVVEPTRRAVWVAGYTGTIGIYDEVPNSESPRPTPSARARRSGR